MMTKTANKDVRGTLLYACNTCGKEDTLYHMKYHIEANHLVACDICEKTFKTRGGLKRHRTKYHRTGDH